MRRILFAVILAAAAFAQAADRKKDAYDIRPEADKAGEALSSVDWQQRNAEALAVATAEDVLAGFVADERSARALLGKIRGAYETDPMAAFQIAAVSQWVMGEEPFVLWFWKPSPAAGRKVWIGALLTTAETASDGYVKVFCLDQLRWCGCGCPEVRERIRGIGEKSGDKAVKDVVALVLRELK